MIVVIVHDLFNVSKVFKRSHVQELNNIYSTCSVSTQNYQITNLNNKNWFCSNFAEEPSVSISISQSMDVDVSLSTDMPCTATMDEDHIPPEFFEEPQSQMVEEGTTAVFTCDVDGDPVPSRKKY